MKNIFTLALLCAFAVAVPLMNSCNNNDDTDEQNDTQSGADKNLTTGQVKLIARPSSTSSGTSGGYNFSFVIQAKKVTVDWNDGSPVQEYRSGTVSHTYLTNDLKTVILSTEGLTSLMPSGYTYEIHFGSCPDLKSFGKFNPYLDGVNYPTALSYLEALTFNRCDSLKTVSLINSRVSVLNLGNLPALKELTVQPTENIYAVASQLELLDISKNTALTTLNVPKNKLTTLDVSNSTALTSLDCSGNQLTTLDVNNSTALTELICSSNRLDAPVLNALFESLSICYSVCGVIIWDNPGSKTSNSTILENKGWRLYR
jgi:Leucine-rich repeat (LRR) protein